MPRVIVFGYHQYAALGLEELLAANAEIAALVTHEDDPHENIWFRTPAAIAREHGIPVYTPENVNAPEFVQHIRELLPDLILSLYFRQLLGQELLDMPPLGALNMHTSLLPKYRGRCPVNWVLVNGETETGVTLHHMVRQADAGDIVAQAVVPIDFTDTAATLHEKQLAAARQLLHEALPAVLDGTAPRRPQDHSQATVFGGRKPADGRIDWSTPAVQIYNLIRAVTHPYPGAFTEHPHGVLYVWNAWPLPDETASATPGTVIVAPDGSVLVATGEGALRLDQVQFDDGAEINAAAAVTAGLLADDMMLR